MLKKRYVSQFLLQDINLGAHTITQQSTVDTGVYGITEANWLAIQNGSVPVPQTNGAALFGYAIETIDYNNDGLTDLAVGAPGDDTCGGTDAGAVYIFNGTGNGLNLNYDSKICDPGEANINDYRGVAYRRTQRRSSGIWL